MKTIELIAARARQVLAAGLKDAEIVVSPCVSVCRMDAGSGLCEGCLRTLDEIAGWSGLGEDGKRRTWALIEQRARGAGRP